MPGTVKSELLPDADRLHKCDGQEKICEIQHLPLDKSHFITAVAAVARELACFIWGMMTENISISSRKGTSMPAVSQG